MPALPKIDDVTKATRSDKYPYLGFGLGLRSDHYEDILKEKPNIDWFEIITENYLVPGGKPIYYLEQIRAHYPLAMHGVSLSIGSTDPINLNYLKQIKELAKHIHPAWISDHLCWTGIKGINLHDLMPLPYTAQAVQHIVSQINRVQDYLGQQILIENVSSYLTYQQSEMTEWEFLTQISEQADCFILLDINNIYVSAYNHAFNPKDYLLGIPKDRVLQMHLAGHSNYGEYIIDTHDAPIIEPVWDLFIEAIKHFGLISTIIERDDHIPPLSELVNELNQARSISQKAFEEKNIA